jgi:hypothetical protein
MSVVLQAPPYVPIVNLNGTSRKALIDQRTESCATLRAAIKALCEMRPNGRDFQTAEGGAYEKARQGHEQRIAALQAVHDDLMKEAEYLYVTGLDTKRQN